MKKGWLSIIIPAYNPDEWLKKMLDSIKAQMKGYPDVEIIVVDDGSKNDVSWLKSYDGIKYKRQRNKGAAAARNTGLGMVTGEYIQFLDADDEIYDNFLPVVFANIREGYDWVAYDWECDKHKEWALQNKGELAVNCAVWAYTFRTDFIGNSRFDASMNYGSDIVWLRENLRDDCKHRHDHSIFYNYRWDGNDNSICHRKLRGEL